MLGTFGVYFFNKVIHLTLQYTYFKWHPFKMWIASIFKREKCLQTWNSGAHFLYSQLCFPIAHRLFLNVAPSVFREAGYKFLYVFQVLLFSHSSGQHGLISFENTLEESLGKLDGCIMKFYTRCFFYSSCFSDLLSAFWVVPLVLLHSFSFSVSNQLVMPISVRNIRENNIKQLKQLCSNISIIWIIHSMSSQKIASQGPPRQLGVHL